ncbi:hypothetical protein [Streptomyces sp. FBKL.4005]|uniref:SCO2400 family protein n=1 Tax=Streptomyces sp. FBKL.4005 TaxID=2015515 RepID=UPI00167BFFBD|nr:hypothetical protein [Streptomyces sp. FBKL.4005]
MDYCPPCQRHLNGALACPGCGTPADRLAVTAAAPAPHAHGQPYQQSYEPYGHDEQPYEAAHEGTYAQPDRPGGPEHPDRSEEADEDGPEDAYETAEDTAPGGRRAARAAGSRRDRKAAVHRRRRRRTVLLAAGFVLAVGGLSLAELGTDAPFSPFSRDTPVPAGDTEAEGGAASAVPGSPAEPVDAVSEAAPGDADDSASPDASASAPTSPKEQEKDSASPSARASDGEQQSSPTGSGSSAASPAGPATTAPAPTPTVEPTTAAPTPAPSPAKTCDRFLWWCT